MKISNKNTCRKIKSVAHLSKLPYKITLKFDSVSPPLRDLLMEKVKLFPFSFLKL
jgi:hypothetical protein